MDARPARHLRLPPHGRPAARDRGARGLPPRRQPRADAPRGDGDGQDGDDGVADRGAAAAGARDRPQQDARGAALQRVPRVLPRERRRVLRLVLRLLPTRGVRPAGRPLHREGLLAERRHRPPPPRREHLARDAAGRGRRRLRVVHLRDRLAGGVRGAGRPPRRGGGVRPRPAPPEARRHPVRPQRHAARARAVPRQGRRRRAATGVPRDRVPDLVLRRRDRADLPLRPAHRGGARPARRPDRVPGDAVRHLEADDRAGGRRDPARARDPGRDVRDRGPDARGPPDPAAHGVRPRDDEGARVLQRDRELLADPRRATRGVRAVHLARLLPVRLHLPDRRVAPDRAADRRDVRGRPVAEADARRLRLPSPLGARQPAAPVRRVPREGRTDGVRVSDARRLRAAALRRRRRAADPTDRGRRSRGRAPRDAQPDRRPAGRDPQARGGQRARPRDDADEEDVRGPDRLPARVGRQGALPPLGDRHARADPDHPRAAARRVRRARRRQPPPRGARPPRGVARRDPRRRQGGLPPRQDGAPPDDRARGAEHPRHRADVRRQGDRGDPGRARRDEPPAGAPARLQRGARDHARVDRQGRLGHRRAARARVADRARAGAGAASATWRG